MKKELHNASVKLLCHAIQRLLDDGKIDLDYRTRGEDGFCEVELLNKKTIIAWINNSFEELRITVWWGVLDREKMKDFEMCGNHGSFAEKDIVFARGYIERKNGIWLQNAIEEGLKVCCSVKSREDLLSIPKCNIKGMKIIPHLCK